jgi:hypothetical protein
MKTYIIIALLFLGLSVYAEDAVPVQPFSNDWPSQNTAMKSAQSNPFDDINTNPDPDPVPLGDSLGWVLILGVGYIAVKYWKPAIKSFKKNK